MEILQAAILGIIQGLTEFLPISSSGHLIVVPSILGWEDFTNNLLFDVALHLGTASAVIVFFRRDWIRIITAFFQRVFAPRDILRDVDSRLFVLILVGTIPAVIAGLLFKDFIVEVLREPQVVAITLILFAFVLWIADRVSSKSRDMTKMRLKDAIFVGLAQAVALIPGVSRSGVTITTGLFTGLNREAAARFSFMLSTPVILGAGVLSVKEAFSSSNNDLGIGAFAVGILTAAIIGFLAIKYLLRYVLTHNYNVFVWYRVLVGVSILVYFLR